MGSNDPVVTVQPISETKRKVSIQSDPVAESRSYENLGYNVGYDLYPRRKISQVMRPIKNYTIIVSYSYS